MTVTRYGIISDIHEDPRIIIPILNLLKQKGTEKLIVNGDIGGRIPGNSAQEVIKNSQNFTAFILNTIGKSGLETFVQPGSHETLLGFEPVINHFSNEYSNIINVLTQRKIERNNHELVFVPGSDFVCGGEYHIGNNDKIPSGKYIQTEKSLIRFVSLDQYMDAINFGLAKDAMHYVNMHEIIKLITHPEKTVMVCHVPRKFDTVETGVDMAHFFELREYAREKEKYETKGVFPSTAFNPLRAKKDNTPVYSRDMPKYELESTIKTELWRSGVDRLRVLVEQKTNRGNADLKKVYDETGLTESGLAFPSAHFHESSHRAHDSNGKTINQHTLVRGLYWNSGHGDRGLCGILTVDNDKVSYENVNVLNH